MATKEFRCANVGYEECDWKLEGNSEEEMLPAIEEHANRVHHLDLKEKARDHIRQAIHEVS